MRSPIFNREFVHPEDGWYMLEANAASGRMSADAAGANVASLANRISREGKLPLIRAYQMVKTNLPSVYNRANSLQTPAPRREAVTVWPG